MIGLVLRGAAVAFRTMKVTVGGLLVATSADELVDQYNALKPQGAPHMPDPTDLLDALREDMKTTFAVMQPVTDVLEALGLLSERTGDDEVDSTKAVQYVQTMIASLEGMISGKKEVAAPSTGAPQVVRDPGRKVTAGVMLPSEIRSLLQDTGYSPGEAARVVLLMRKLSENPNLADSLVYMLQFGSG